MRAPDFLRKGAAVFEERNRTYGDNYLHAGAALAAMFPGGLTVRSAEDWARLSLFVNCYNKLSRYAQNLTTGGHLDSALDLSVYAAMLAEMTHDEAQPVDRPAPAGGTPVLAEAAGPRRRRGSRRRHKETGA